MRAALTRLARTGVRLDGGRLFVVLLVGAYLLAATVVGIALLLVAVTGQWDSLSWSAAGTLASIVSTLIAIGAAAAIGFTVREYQGQLRRDARDRQRDRLDRQPYLRVDIAFADRHEPSFQPPSAGHIYMLGELRLWEEDPLLELRPPLWAAYHTLTLWVTNQQVHQLGLADDVEIATRVTWRSREDDSTYAGAPITVRLAYLAPGQTTAVGLGHVRRDLAELYAVVEDVTYRDMFGDRFKDTHGALEMAYTGIEVRNGRAAIRSLGSPATANGDKGDRGQADEPRGGGSLRG